MKTVIIVNGKPRAGKDSTIEAMTNLLKAAQVPVGVFSSIDPIRDMLTGAGFDLSAKTEQDRSLMAEVGDAVEKHSQFRSRLCAIKTLDFFEGTEASSAVMFIHVREKAIIDRVCQIVRNWPGGGYSTLKVLVQSSRSEEVTSNAADAGVMSVVYDDLVNNNGTLDDLARSCDLLLYRHGLVDQLSLLR